MLSSLVYLDLTLQEIDITSADAVPFIHTISFAWHPLVALLINIGTAWPVRNMMHRMTYTVA